MASEKSPLLGNNQGDTTPPQYGEPSDGKFSLFVP